MKLATFTLKNETADSARVGVVVDGSVIDLQAAQDRFGSQRTRTPSEMVALLSCFDEMATAVDELVERSLKQQLQIPLADCRLLAPVPRPNTIRDCATYIKHATSGISS